MAGSRRNSTSQFFEVLGYETGLPVSIAVWHVRSVRPIREAELDNECVTRIEFTNGDVLDCDETVPSVLKKIQEALRCVE